MVSFARASSPAYRAAYRDLPDRVEDPRQLPVTSKAELTRQFDGWVTDRRVAQAAVNAFVADPALVGERFQGRYTAATTSGTTGTRGVFVIDARDRGPQRPAGALAPHLAGLAGHLGHPQPWGADRDGDRLRSELMHASTSVRLLA